MVPARMHGRLAITFWPTKPSLAQSVGPPSPGIRFEERDYSCTVTTNKQGTPLIQITVPLPERTPYQLNLDATDWQGIIEGYYEPTAAFSNAQAHETNFVWIGNNKIAAKPFTPKQFEALCLGIKSATEHLRFHRSKCRHLLPIGRFWGMISVQDYCCQRLAGLLNKEPQPAFGERFNNLTDDFGYYVVRTPRQQLWVWKNRKTKS